MRRFMMGVGAFWAATAGWSAESGANAKPAAWRLDFENYVPGQAPREWTFNWGSQGDDLITVTSDHASGGKQALLFDRPESPDAKGQWGAAVSLPGFRDGQGTLSWDFLFFGAGGDARFSFEIRNRSAKRIVRLGVEFQRASFGEFWGEAKKAAVRPGVWYRMEATVDAGGGAAARSVRLRLRERGAAACLLDEAAAGEKAAPLEKAAGICLCFGQTAGPFRLYVDSVEMLSAAP